MSNPQFFRRPSRSSRSAGSKTAVKPSAHQVSTATHHISSVTSFRPCAATVSHFLYAQGNLIVSLHHDTLAIDRHFDKHREDVLLIAADNVSELGAGRFVASYDAGQTAIIWNIFTGEEVARFTAYEQIQVAAWTREGNVAFGNSQGNIILFEPSTAEHISARTIVDPVTALAPAADSRTFAIGYLNGSILVALLQPTFTILHTLPPTRAPSPITGLAWHGSPSKQRSDMLATQTSGGDLRIWSVSKTGHAEPPRIIRVLRGPENAENGGSWFAWSKNGRIIQHLDEETRIWDVRTKDVTHNNVSDVRDVAGIANYGPGAVLFTIARDSTVQQYDINPQNRPTIVANAQRLPSNAPSIPPDSHESTKTLANTMRLHVNQRFAAFALDLVDSTEDNAAISPLEKIVQDMRYRKDKFDDEERDFVGPMSPASSKASATSSSSYGHRDKPQQRDRGARPLSGSKQGSEGTLFSPVSSLLSEQESHSIRSSSSATSSRYRAPSSLRHEMLRSPDEPKNMKMMDLFPYARKRQQEIRFRLPQCGQSVVTTDLLRGEMLSIVFGWEGDVEALIRDEYSRHEPGSASGVLLSKWLGELGADSLAQMVGSESMTSSDWMLLALSCSMGQGSQKAVGEAFVKRLLESDEVHPAVAILLGLGEEDQAIAVYASRKFYFEAIVLTCLLFPGAWQRQVMLLREWAEAAALNGQPEFAARCFACAAYQPTDSHYPSSAPSDPFTLQSKMYSANASTSPLSTTSGRITTKTASLKLITNFGDNTFHLAPATTVGVTPILESALSPSKDNSWTRSNSRPTRDPSSARTVTPGTSRGRHMRSVTDMPRDVDNEIRTPSHRDGSQVPRRPAPSLGQYSSVRTTFHSPAPDVPNSLLERTQTRKPSKGRSQNRVQVDSRSQVDGDDEYNILTSSTASRGQRRRVSGGSDRLDRSQQDVVTHSRARSDSSYTHSGKRSPSSPVPMTSEDAKKHVLSSPPLYDDERFYRVDIPDIPTASRAVGLAVPKTKYVPLAQNSNQHWIGSSDVTHDRVSEGRGQKSPSAMKTSSPPSTPDVQRLRKSSTKPVIDGLQDPQHSFDITPRVMSRKELAARELEERRLSLARRPSVPIIPHPADLSSRPSILSRSITDVTDSSTNRPWPSSVPHNPLGARSHTVDPETMMRLGSEKTGNMTANQGLPANFNATLHPKQKITTQQQGALLPRNVPSQSGSAAAYQLRIVERSNDTALLPSTVFSLRTPPTRSASAPPESLVTTGSPAAGYVRRESREHTSSNHKSQQRPSEPKFQLPVGVKVVTEGEADEDDDNVIVVDVSKTEPHAILAELQHLDIPPPPPAVQFQAQDVYSSPSRARHSAALSSSSVGVINIAMERIPSPQSRMGTPAAAAITAVAARPTPSSSPSLRRRSSVTAGVTDTASSIGNKWRNVAERIRSNSKSRAKSPPVMDATFTPSPYETVLGSYPFLREMRASPPQGPHATRTSAAMSPLMEQAVAPESRLRSNSNAAVVEYRNLKDLRAKPSSQQLISGSVSMQGGMI